MEYFSFYTFIFVFWDYRFPSCVVPCAVGIRNHVNQKCRLQNGFYIISVFILKSKQIRMKIYDLNDGKV